MKKMYSPVCASVIPTTKNFSFSAGEVLSLLSSIEELQGIDISVDITVEGTLCFVVGENLYSVWENGRKYIVPAPAKGGKKM